MSNQNQSQEIKIADNIPGAEYANLAYINHNKDEFQIVYVNIMPPSGRVVSKVITNPGHFKRLVRAMNENLKRYEEQFGEVKESVDLGKEIGFKAN